MTSRPNTRPAGDDLRSELSALRARVERLAAELADMQAHAATLEALAHEDPLTGVSNRRGFMRDLARAIAYRARYGTPAALLVADLDSFKPINDAHGHVAGDRALAHVADLIRRNVRASDSIGRIGGDEFAVIIWQVDEAAALMKARALEALLAETPLAIDGLRLSLGMSVGASLLQPKDSPEEALARADHAMYAIKATRSAVRR